MNPPVESRPLRQFVVVAEELNFARAAERLRISAPALSRTVARLEAQLGVTLFERSTRSVEFTVAGRTLYEEAVPALDALDAAATRAQRAATAPEKPLVLAVKADLDGGLLQESADAYAREQGTALELRFCGWGQQPELLRSGEADVALIYYPQERVNETEIDFQPLLEEPQLLAVAANHEFAGRAGLRMEDLQARHTCEPGSTIWVPRLPGGGAAERPRIADMSQLLKFVELGEIVALLPASLAERFGRPQITYRPVRDADPAVLAVAWPRRSRSRATAAYVRVVEELAAQRENSAGPGAALTAAN